jgi:formylglycine-generating enzyme required for sulfatase activity
MIYKHQYFKLNTESRKVFDENNKELVLTGNAYRLLVFLCGKNNATITDINEHFDPAGAKDYTENHIRQYRYKINSIIGHNIAEYKNNIYSINGEITKYQNGNDFEAANPKIQKKEENIVKEEVANLTPKNNKNLFSKNNLVISTVIILLIIFSAIVLRNKKNTDVSQKSNPVVTIEPTSPKTPDNMILIPAGNFTMGSTEQQALDSFALCKNDCSKDDYLAEYPKHPVFVNDFYKLFVQATNHEAPPYWNDSNLDSPNQPVVGANFNDAKTYCEWLGKRLPTEAEREKAARGTDGRIWPWGNNFDNAKSNHGKGSNPSYDNSDGYEYTAPVGTELGVSPYGVLNMAGNVWEWTTDDFNPYPGNDKFTHENYNKGYKVVRGGAYDEDTAELHTANRYGYVPDDKDSDIGFRCVKDK